jgi:hypothetical protein
MFTATYGQGTQTFDIATFQPPTGWKTQPGQLSVQFSTEDSAGAFCLITLYKSLPGLGDSKENFAAAWQTVVKEAVPVSNAPQMQPSNPADWTIEMGSAPFEKDGAEGRRCARNGQRLRQDDECHDYHQHSGVRVSNYAILGVFQL